MGQKVNPVGLRLSVNKNWVSTWYVNKQNYAKVLHEDFKIREIVRNKYGKAGVIKIAIDRFPEKIHVKLHSTKPGIVIGQKGKNIEMLRGVISKIVNKPLEIKIIEVAKPDGSAHALSENIAIQLEDRIPFRRCMKQALRSAMLSGAKGIRILVSGRLNGADMARSQQYLEGRLPLHTLRAMIDYGFAEADTTYGKIGVKVWVYNGDYLGEKTESEKEESKYIVRRRES